MTPIPNSPEKFPLPNVDHLLGTCVGRVRRAVGAVLAVVEVGASGAAAAAEVARALGQEGDASTGAPIEARLKTQNCLSRMIQDRDASVVSLRNPHVGRRICSSVQPSPGVRYGILACDSPGTSPGKGRPIQSAPPCLLEGRHFIAVLWTSP